MAQFEISQDSEFAMLTDETGQLYLSDVHIEHLEQDWVKDSGPIIRATDPVNAIATKAFKYVTNPEVGDQVISNAAGEVMYAIAANQYEVAEYGPERPPHTPITE